MGSYGNTMYTLSYDNGAAYECYSKTCTGPNQHNNNASFPRFISTCKTYRFCHACFVGLYNLNGAREKAVREGTLKKQEELEKAYEVKIRKQIADGELQIP